MGDVTKIDDVRPKTLMTRVGETLLQLFVFTVFLTILAYAIGAFAGLIVEGYSVVRGG